MQINKGWVRLGWQIDIFMLFDIYKSNCCVRYDKKNYDVDENIDAVE